MMQLGFASAILPDLDLPAVLDLAAQYGIACVEVMCWPHSKAERRYAGITHIDVAQLTDAEVAQIRGHLDRTGVAISALGYYPNPLAPEAGEAAAAQHHLRLVIQAAARLDLQTVNTFVGRDWRLSLDANWPRFLQVWRPLVGFAADHGIRIGIENCPMFFTGDEWPGGKNLAVSPAIWRRMFQDIPDANFGLNYDPSHLVWQHMDYLAPLREFTDRIFHVHAKDVRLDQERLNQVGILAHPLEYHAPKLPGLGEIQWGRFLGVLADTGYQGPVCVEVEDRAYEASLAARQESLRQSADYLHQFMPRIV